ncbi:MAG: hypothetical protein M1837_005727 [Sclerophora amabilis]|nr:MAG: hypothetical protein M1837_005727 [Sclerophora amabilis]
MPPVKKRGKSGFKSQTARTNTKPSIQAIAQKPANNPAKISASRYGTRSGLRSNLPAESALLFDDNPESILRRSRKFRRGRGTTPTPRRPPSPTARWPDRIVQSIEKPLAVDHWLRNIAGLGPYPDRETSSSSEAEDPNERFYRKWGYLPPLDEGVAALIDAIVADPNMAKEFARIGPDNKEYAQGLARRNVQEMPSSSPDEQEDHIKGLIIDESPQETETEKKLHEQLWSFDRAKCEMGSNEALFQRTLLMGSIARHLFIYERAADKPCYLDFSVEEPWTCPPMPTRAYQRDEKFLTQPKPDLAICFRREALIPNFRWNELPGATQQLACFESSAKSRAFHFLAIEAKKADIGSHNLTALRQCLNSASQALHNMFEFFRDAGHEQKFYDQVRFFSVAAGSEGLVIRIHRAVRESRDNLVNGLIIDGTPDYPLRFEYRVFCNIAVADFDRTTVLETFTKILIGYGVGELRPLLSNAAEALEKKLKNDPLELKKRDAFDFYRYGQTKLPPSTGQHTPASRLETEKSLWSHMSVDRQQSEGAMPPPPPRKRTRTGAESADSASAKTSRRRKQ